MYLAAEYNREKRTCASERSEYVEIDLDYVATETLFYFLLVAYTRSGPSNVGFTDITHTCSPILEICE